MLALTSAPSCCFSASVYTASLAFLATDRPLPILPNCAAAGVASTPQPVSASRNRIVKPFISAYTSACGDLSRPPRRPLERASADSPALGAPAAPHAGRATGTIGPVGKRH